MRAIRNRQNKKKEKIIMNISENQQILRKYYKAHNGIYPYNFDEFKNQLSKTEASIGWNKISIREYEDDAYAAYYVQTDKNSGYSRIFNITDGKEYVKLENGNSLYCTRNCQVVPCHNPDNQIVRWIKIILSIAFCLASIYISISFWAKFDQNIFDAFGAFGLLILVILIIANIQIIFWLLPDRHQLNDVKLEDIKKKYYKLGIADAELDMRNYENK